MIMKTISMMHEKERRAAMVRLKALIDEGYSASDIASRLNIPESEIRECIDWVQTHKNPN